MSGQDDTPTVCPHGLPMTQRCAVRCQCGHRCDEHAPEGEWCFEPVMGGECPCERFVEQGGG